MLCYSAKVSRILTVIVIVLKLLKCHARHTENEMWLIDDAVTKWAPVVEFHEQEKYFPLSAEEFLEFVYPAHSDGTPAHWDLPVGRSSHGVHLTTKADLDQLKSSTSFLNGRNPKTNPVPVYVTVSTCPRKSQSTQTSFVATYWMFFPFNEGKGVCFVGKAIPMPHIFNKCLLGNTRKLGNHVGDFEHITISFDANYQPIQMFVSTHNIGAYYEYNKDARVFKFSRSSVAGGFLQNVKFPWAVMLEKGRPSLYAARGSHGLWAARGIHRYHKVPNLYDMTGGGPKWKTWENIQIYHLDYSIKPNWMQFFGKWGNPKSNCWFLGICELADAPHGIADRPHDIQC